MEQMCAYRTKLTKAKTTVLLNHICKYNNILLFSSVHYYSIEYFCYLLYWFKLQSILFTFYFFTGLSTFMKLLNKNLHLWNVMLLENQNLKQNLLEHLVIYNFGLFSIQSWWLLDDGPLIEPDRFNDVREFCRCGMTNFGAGLKK